MMPTVAELLQTANQALATVSPTALLDAEILLCDVLGKGRTWLRTWPDNTVSEEQLSAFNQYLARRCSGEPIAYIVGEQEFWSLPFKVTPATLIPRPETELLVELTLELIVESDAEILDLGTGSGAIAVALASEKPSWRVSALDYQNDALEVAKQNALRNNVAITFYRSNWFDELPKNVRFDALLSNPPYIEKGNVHLSEGDVRFEPMTALVAENNGYADIEHIAAQGVKYLKQSGWLMLEHGFDQGAKVRDIFIGVGYQNVVTRMDLAGLERVTVGQFTTISAN